jgi:hypothetical protein
MQFKLFQIKLSNQEVDTINAQGHGSVPKHKMKLDMSMKFKGDISSIAKEALDNGFYTHVSNITAENLNHVFQVGNIGPEENIERLAPMHSVSVADIIVEPNGTKHVVASMGFQEIS